MTDATLYEAIIKAIFDNLYKKGATELPFLRDEIVEVARRLKLARPKNVGDLLYSFRHRTDLPDSIRSRAPAGYEWLIRSRGRGKYAFTLARQTAIKPNAMLAETKVPDATPGIIAKYALTDEQALLAKLRYNRLIDIFTGVASYSLQSHLRTTVPKMGQMETDEVYVGIDKAGAQYIFPVQAKGGRDKLGAVQIEGDLAMCAHKFPGLICRPIGAQFMQDDVIAMFELELNRSREIRIAHEKHYRLVAPDDVTDADLLRYRKLR